MYNQSLNAYSSLTDSLPNKLRQVIEGTGGGGGGGDGAMMSATDTVVTTERWRRLEFDLIYSKAVRNWAGRAGRTVSDSTVASGGLDGWGAQLE